jgi:NAD+ synthase
VNTPDLVHTFSTAVLAIDPERVSKHVQEAIASQVHQTLRRRGAVVALSGGVDSAVSAAQSVRALGPNRVVGVLMPERDSSDDALTLGMLLAESLGIESIVENIAPTLEAAGCYERQTEAIRTVCPDYSDGWKCKITLPSILEGNRLNVFELTVLSPGGTSEKFRLPLSAYLQLVAATNFKQRTRAMMAYYHADRLNYAVVGTPNRLEYDQGFFVKLGDGAADLKPIAHLYKTQVYALAAHLGVPQEILRRPPTTDTYSLPQSQEEFYFALPYQLMDLCLYGHNHGVPAEEVAPAIGLTAEQVARVYKDIEAKRRATRYLHHGPLLVQEVQEIHMGRHSGE